MEVSHGALGISDIPDLEATIILSGKQQITNNGIPRKNVDITIGGVFDFQSNSSGGGKARIPNLNSAVDAGGGEAVTETVTVLLPVDIFDGFGVCVVALTLVDAPTYVPN